MEFKLSFKMDNAAFGGGMEVFEAARILRRVAESLEAENSFGTCRDANGNTVGSWEVSE